jgi:hypothetical protein
VFPQNPTCEQQVPAGQGGRQGEEEEQMLVMAEAGKRRISAWRIYIVKSILIVFVSMKFV